MEVRYGAGRRENPQAFFFNLTYLYIYSFQGGEEVWSDNSSAKSGNENQIAAVLATISCLLAPKILHGKGGNRKEELEGR